MEHEQNQRWTLVTVRGSQSGPGEEDDSWTLVTRKERKVKPNAHILQPVQPKPKPKPVLPQSMPAEKKKTAKPATPPTPTLTVEQLKEALEEMKELQRFDAANRKPVTLKE